MTLRVSACEEASNGGSYVGIWRAELLCFYDSNPNGGERVAFVSRQLIVVVCDGEPLA